MPSSLRKRKTSATKYFLPRCALAAGLYALAIICCLPRLIPNLEVARYFLVSAFDLAGIAIATAPLALSGRWLGHRAVRLIPITRRVAAAWGTWLLVSVGFFGFATILLAALLSAAEVQNGYEGRRRTCAVIFSEDQRTTFVIYDHARVYPTWSDAEIGVAYGPLVFIEQHDTRGFDALFAQGFSAQIDGIRLELLTDTAALVRKRARIDEVPATLQRVQANVD